MKFVEKTAKTVEDALALALIELDAKESDVEYEVLEEGSKGLFGFFGKDTTIRVTMVDRIEDRALNFLKDMFKAMNLEVNVDIKLENNILNINFEGPNMALLIGRRGQTLDSIQYLVSLVVNKNREEYVRVLVDTENYRKKRKETLEKLANKLAYKAKKMRKDIILEPMNPYERRIIHSALQGNPHVSTRSEGEEPFRKVIIFLNR